jgi:uncharacterized protein
MKGLLKGKKPATQLLVLVSVTLGSFFLFGLLGTVILSRVTGMDLMTMSDTTKWNAADERIVWVIRGMQLVQFICLFLIPCFICARLFSLDASKYLGFVPPHNPLYYLVGCALLLLAIPLTNYVGELNRLVEFPSGIASWMKEQEEEAARTIKILLSKRTPADLVLNLFFIAVLAAVGEELLFRGMAQRILTRWFRSPWAAIIVTAILFSAMHVQFYGFIPRLILGVLLGALYWYSGSLWTAILAHFVYDALLITLVYFQPSMLNDQPAGATTTLLYPALMSLFAISALMTWMIKKSKSVHPDMYAEDAIPLKDHPF